MDNLLVAKLLVDDDEELGSLEQWVPMAMEFLRWKGQVSGRRHSGIKKEHEEAIAKFLIQEAVLLTDELGLPEYEC